MKARVDGHSSHGQRMKARSDAFLRLGGVFDTMSGVKRYVI
jgi:hypothetical protein